MNVTDPPEIPAPVSVYVVIVPLGTDHVNGMVVPVGVPAARLDGTPGGGVYPPTHPHPIVLIYLKKFELDVHNHSSPGPTDAGWDADWIWIGIRLSLMRDPFTS